MKVKIKKLGLLITIFIAFFILTGFKYNRIPDLEYYNKKIAHYKTAEHVHINFIDDEYISGKVSKIYKFNQVTDLDIELNLHDGVVKIFLYQNGILILEDELSKSKLSKKLSYHDKDGNFKLKLIPSEFSEVDVMIKYI